MDMHWVLIYVKDVVVNVLRIFFDHQLEDRFVELNKINLSERLNREHRDLLDHIEMLLKRKFRYDFIIRRIIPARTDA
jgi:hypothetical protein